MSVSSQPRNAPAVDIARPEPAPVAAPVFISEREVLFGTAAAVLPPSRSTGRRLAAALQRMLAALPSLPAPRPCYLSSCHYLEDSRMAREMLRL